MSQRSSWWIMISSAIQVCSLTSLCVYSPWRSIKTPCPQCRGNLPQQVKYVRCILQSVTGGYYLLFSMTLRILFEILMFLMTDYGHHWRDGGNTRWYSGPCVEGFARLFEPWTFCCQSKPRWWVKNCLNNRRFAQRLMFIQPAIPELVSGSHWYTIHGRSFP